MNAEQAVAWLILEGWVAVEGKLLRWLPLDGRVVHPPRLSMHLRDDVVDTGDTTWSIREFDVARRVCPSKYPQYAAQVVDMILSGAVLGETS